MDKGKLHPRANFHQFGPSGKQLRSAQLPYCVPASPHCHTGPACQPLCRTRLLAGLWPHQENSSAWPDSLSVPGADHTGPGSSLTPRSLLSPFHWRAGPPCHPPVRIVACSSSLAQQPQRALREIAAGASPVCAVICGSITPAPRTYIRPL